MCVLKMCSECFRCHISYKTHISISENLQISTLLSLAMGRTEIKINLGVRIDIWIEKKKLNAILVFAISRKKNNSSSAEVSSCVSHGNLTSVCFLIACTWVTRTQTHPWRNMLLNNASVAASLPEPAVLGGVTNAFVPSCPLMQLP